MKARARKAPPPRDSWASAVEEAQELAGKSFEEHYWALEAACRLAFAVLEHHPERGRLLDSQEPLPADTRALLARLRARGRK